jgi:two-component system sensor histidine kinase BarA
MVGNGDEAIAACETQQFDIVLMDIHMPKTNGVEATKRIRAHQTSCKSMPIVALTADAMADDQLAFIEAGMNDVMIKPVNEELLVNKILYLTNKQATDHSAEELSPPTTTTAKSALKSGPGAKETTSLSSKSASSKGASKDNKLAGEIMGLLIKELPAFKQSIQTSHQQGNYDSLYQHVHKLHGALSYCDLPKIKPMIQKIERDLKLNRRETLALDLNALFQELDELIQHIKQ